MPRMKAGSRELTQKQKDILNFIISYIRTNAYPPSIREVGDHFGIKSTNGVFDHLNALARKGYIKRQYFRSRSIVVLMDANAQPTESAADHHACPVPLLGEAAGGSPITPFEEAAQYVAVDVDLLPKKTDKLFAVKVRGDSMIGDGIGDGDMIFVQKATTLREGQIGLFKIGDESAVKQYFTEGNAVILKSSNKAYKPIKVEKMKDFKIYGKVIGVFHSLD